jgi:predicted HTH transcriptional regulator
MNGGYIVIGIEERFGKPILPPVGLDEKALVIIEKVVKYPDRAEADRFFTYPYAAIEEVSSRRKIIENGKEDRNGLTEVFTENLTEKEIEVLRLMKENQGYTTSDMAERLCVSRQTIAARIKALKQKNVIRREGSDTNGHWEFICD